MTYNRVPEQFMKGIFMAPHTFNDPQNPQHADYVNLQLRNDLYYSTLQDISNIQFKMVNISSEQQWIKVESMSPCKQTGQKWFHQYSDTYKKKKGKTLSSNDHMKVELLSCQDWLVAYHTGKEKTVANYRVHILQSDTDIFKSQIYPPSFFKTLKDLLIN